MDKGCVSYGQMNFFFNPLYQGNRKTFLELSMGPYSEKWYRLTPITIKTMVLVQLCANISFNM